MNKSFLQQYKFREQNSGTMVGGFSINNILESDISHLEPFSVPVGLYVSTSGSMSGGNVIHDAKIIIGGAIEEEHFEKLYGVVAKHMVKSRKSSVKTQKIKK
uniref:Uncharacterized protein n=1 Tax=viral metagenome TaxID=1070528 RepID=A0A6C0B3M9_9ZZZZ